MGASGTTPLSSPVWPFSGDMGALSTTPPSFLPWPFLLIPCFALLALLAQSISCSLMFMLWHKFGNHFAWPPAGAKPPPHCPPWVFDGRQSARRYRRGVDGAVRCVFCLCDVEEGEEVRELRCEHLFHRACLDRWVGHGRVTCPLCRESLVASKAAEADLPCEEEVELGLWAVVVAVHLRVAWWAR